MDWSDVQVFLAVARSGSLAAAGRTLNLAQPTVGRRLSALEASLRATLFQRTHTGLTLTEEGLAVVAAAERMEEEALAFQRRLEGTGQHLQGLLRVTASDWFGTHFLAPMLAEFASLNPGVQIELLTDARVYDLTRREADLAFRITPFESLDIVSRRFMDIEYGLFATESAASQVKDTSQVRLIAMNDGFSAMPDMVWLQRHFPSARVVFTSNSREVQAQACVRGVGLAVLPLMLATRYPQLVQLPTAEPPPPRATWLGYHRDLKRLGRLRALLDHLDSRATQ